MDKSTGNQLREKKAQHDADTAQSRYDAIRDKANTAYKADSEKGSISLMDWARRNYPTLGDAQKALSDTTANLNAVRADLYGSQADVLNQQQQAIRLANDITESHAG